MNKLKSDMKDRNIEFLMTYADNLAIQYFKKQGFSDTIQIPKEIWKGYLKDYDGSTHMECLINPKINYSEIASQIKEQKKVASTHQCVIDARAGRYHKIRVKSPVLRPRSAWMPAGLISSL